jgi:hypothetical protein
MGRRKPLWPSAGRNRLARRPRDDDAPGRSSAWLAKDTNRVKRPRCALAEVGRQTSTRRRGSTGPLADRTDHDFGGTPEPGPGGPRSKLPTTQRQLDAARPPTSSGAARRRSWSPSRSFEAGSRPWCRPYAACCSARRSCNLRRNRASSGPRPPWPPTIRIRRPSQPSEWNRVFRPRSKRPPHRRRLPQRQLL